MKKTATKRPAKRKPDDLLKRVNRAIEKLVAEDFAGALADLEPLVGESKGHDHLAFVVLQHRGRAKAELGDQVGALRDYDRAIVLAPAESDLRNNRAMIYLHRGDHERAEADLRVALEDDFLGAELSEEYALLRCTLAEVLVAAGDPDGALVALERAVHLDPTWRVEAPKLDSLKALRKDPRWKQILAGKHIFWLAQPALLRLCLRKATLDETRPAATKLGKYPVTGPLRQLFAFHWTDSWRLRAKGVTTSRIELGFTDVPTERELDLVEDRKRPWVIWGRGDAGELVLIALDDPAPENPTVHVVRQVAKRVFRSKKRLDAWLT